MAQVMSVRQMAEDQNLQNDEEDLNDLGRWFVRTQNGESQNVFVEQTEEENDNGDITYSVTFRVSPYGEDDIQVDVFHPNEPAANPPTYVLMDPQDAADEALIAIANNQNDNNNMQNNNNNAPHQGGKRRNSSTSRKSRKSRSNSRKSRKNSRKSRKNSRKSRKSRKNRSSRRH